MAKSNKKQATKGKNGLSTTGKVAIAAVVIVALGGSFILYKDKKRKDELAKANSSSGGSNLPNSQTLTIGSKGSDVKALQQLLMANAAKENPPRVALPKYKDDGSFGQETAEELKRQTGFSSISKSQFTAWQGSGTFKADVPTPAALTVGSLKPKAEQLYNFLFTNTPVINAMNYTLAINEPKFKEFLALLATISSKDEFDTLSSFVREITRDKMSFVTRFRDEPLSFYLSAGNYGSVILTAAQRTQLNQVIGKFLV